MHDIKEKRVFFIAHDLKKDVYIFYMLSFHCCKDLTYIGCEVVKCATFDVRKIYDSYLMNIF